jgi:hypothetical protein
MQNGMKLTVLCSYMVDSDSFRGRTKKNKGVYTSSTIKGNSTNNLTQLPFLLPYTVAFNCDSGPPSPPTHLAPLSSLGFGLLVALLLVTGDLRGSTLRGRTCGEREGGGTRCVCGPRGGHHRVHQQARQELEGRRGLGSVASGGSGDRPAVPNRRTALDFCRNARWHSLIVSLEDSISMESIKVHSKSQGCPSIYSAPHAAYSCIAIAIEVHDIYRRQSSIHRNTSMRGLSVGPLCFWNKSCILIVYTAVATG